MSIIRPKGDRMAVERDQEFVESVVRTLVEKPDAVVVKRTVDEMGVLLELTVDKEDMGVVIGKEGRTAKAIRTLLRVLGAKNDSRVNLKIVDPEGDDFHKKSEKPAAEEQATEALVEEKTETPEVEEDITPEAPAKEEAVEEEDEERPMADLEI